MAEVLDGEVERVVEEERIATHVEVGATAESAPRVEGPQVEVAAPRVGHAPDRGVAHAQIGLVVGRGGDVAAHHHLEVGPCGEPRGEGVASGHGVVARPGEVHREIAARQHAEEVLLQLVVAHLPLHAAGAAVGLHEVADVGALRARQPLEGVVVEDQGRTLGAECRAALREPCRVAPLGHGSQQTGHLLHGVGVAHVHDGRGIVEIEHAHGHGAADHDAAVGGQVVVRVVHGQHESLVHEVVVLAGRGIALGAHRTHDQVGRKLRVERLPGEIIVDAAVVEQHRIDLHGFEHQRNRHRRAHRLRKVAVAQDHAPAGVHVARHAEERHHQVVETPPGSGRGGGEELHQGHIHGRGGEQVRGEHEALAGLRVAEIQPQPEERRHTPRLAVIGHAVGVDVARDPFAHDARLDDGPHLGGRIPRGVHGGDDRPHGGSGRAIDGDSVLFERFEHSDVVEALGAAAAHDHTHALRRRRTGGQHSPKDKSEGSSQHFSVFFITLHFRC